MDRRESVSALRRVVYFSARSFAAIQFSRPQAPCLSAELSGEPPNFPEPLKRPPLGGPQALPRLWGGYSLVPLLGCQKVPLHQPEKYTTRGPDVNKPDPDFRGIPSAFQADLGLTNPCLSADLPLQVSRTFGSPRRLLEAPPRCRRGAIVALLVKRSSRSGKIFRGPSDQAAETKRA
jgi:hypothetical protein